MKTKKFIVYVLISLFVFSPFLNLEGWASSQTLPIMKLGACKVLRYVCWEVGDKTCCERYCCSSDSETSCVLDQGYGPLCSYSPPAPNRPWLK